MAVLSRTNPSLFLTRINNLIAFLIARRYKLK